MIFSPWGQYFQGILAKEGLSPSFARLDAPGCDFRGLLRLFNGITLALEPEAKQVGLSNATCRDT